MRHLVLRQGAHADAASQLRSRERRLYAGMTGTDDDDVENVHAIRSLLPDAEAVEDVAQEIVARAPPDDLVQARPRRLQIR
jgi:hypothetical protein